MNDRSLLNGLIEALTILVLRREKDSKVFQLVEPVPDWYCIFSGKTIDEVLASQSYFDSPFLQNFLADAHEFWDTARTGRIGSGFWCEPDVDGQDHEFEAIAVAQEDVKLLVIQKVYGETSVLQEVLQAARESGLEHHQAMVEQKQVEQVLGSKLERSEQRCEDLVAILDRLRLGTIMANIDGRVTFLSLAAQKMLKTTESAVAGQVWSDIQAFSEKDHMALQDMLQRPLGERVKVPIVLEHGKGRRVSLEIDVQEDPRDPQRTIFFLYDVTEAQDLRELLTEKSRFFDLVGKSQAMADVYRRIQDIASVEATVLIEGETGTGKELVARAIHQASSRKDHPFVAVNCAGLTDSLLGSQLFGHKRGAFTGATHDHQGFFEAANSGTLFLDEIGDMPLNIQTTLLRVLQEKEIVRLGESHPRKVDVRVVTATHQNLQELVNAGSFRSDLMYRVRVARIQLPALRDRREDIPLLSTVFFGQSRATTKKENVQEISDKAMQILIKYPWPGNVRELKSAIDYAFIHCHGSVIEPSDLPPECSNPVAALPLAIEPPVDEKEQILEALRRAKGKRAEAARILGMSRSTLYRRLESFGLPSKG